MDYKLACQNILTRMKKAKGVKKRQEANMMSALIQVLRGTKKKNESNPASLIGTMMESSVGGRTNIIRILEAKDAPQVVAGVPPEGPMLKVVLISEGLGNRNNMNYYGPEAIASAPPVFEGRPCFLDHPSDSEAKDIPERRVRDKVGYFKNVKNEPIAGENCITGELHFDLTECARQAYLKGCTALHYKSEFPDLDNEYVGLSINADGEWERRTIQLGEQKLDVNYVTRFTNAMSCDIVTSPARGGRFLALVESAAGVVINKNKEVESMKKGFLESLKAAHTALKEAAEEKDLTKKAEKVAEARKLFDAFLKEAEKKAADEESEDEGYKKESEDEDESEDEGGSADTETTVTHKMVKKTGKAAASKEDEDGDGKDDDKDDDVVESRRLAIKAFAKESGVILTDYRIEKLALMPFKEAREEILDAKNQQKMLIRDVAKKFNVPVSNFERMSESDRQEDGSRNNDLFSDLVK